MPTEEQHIRDLERIETVGEAGSTKGEGPGSLRVRVRGGTADFSICEFEYIVKAVDSYGSGDVVLIVDPIERTSDGILIVD